MKKMLSKYPILTRNTRHSIRAELERKGHRFFSVPDISEGEKLCSVAVGLGLCQAVLSNDGDLIPMGTRCIIKEIKDGLATIFTYNDIIHKLKLSHEQLVSLCILLGNDFNDGIVGMGKVKCYNEVCTRGFNIYKFNRQLCGILRVSICIRALTISRDEYKLVQEEASKQLT
jgi:5'-3' exonuclease